MVDWKECAVEKPEDMSDEGIRRYYGKIVGIRKYHAMRLMDDLTATLFNLECYARCAGCDGAAKTLKSCFDSICATNMDIAIACKRAQDMAEGRPWECDKMKETEENDDDDCV